MSLHSGDVSVGKPAARLDDKVHCPIHGAVPTIGGSHDTFLDHRPALVLGDKTACGDTIIQGSSSVFINGKPAAVVSCATAHGGAINTGSPTVIIGTAHCFAAARLDEPPASGQCDQQNYSLAFDFSAMHEAGNHNGIDYGDLPIEITDTDGTYITTVRTDGSGVSDRFFTEDHKEIIAWLVGSDRWEVVEEYEMIEDEDTPSEAF